MDPGENYGLAWIGSGRRCIDATSEVFTLIIRLGKRKWTHSCVPSSSASSESIYQSSAVYLNLI